MPLLSLEELPDLPLEVLLGPAVERARKGIPVTKSLEMASIKVAKELKDSPYYQRIFTRSGKPLACGEEFKNPGLAHLLECLIADGLDSFIEVRLAEISANFCKRSDLPSRQRTSRLMSPPTCWC